MRTAAALCLLLALLSGCSGEPAPDIDGQLKRLGVAVAGFEQAVRVGTDDEQIVSQAERVNRAADLSPDDTWTDEHRRRLIDLLKAFDAAVERWKSAEPGREAPGVTVRSL